MTEPYLTLSETAKTLKVSEKTVSRLLQAGELVGFKIGQQWRFRNEDVSAYVEKQIAKQASSRSKGK